MTFAEFLREKRLENQLSQQMLAEKSGVSQLTISRVESGKTGMPNRGTVVKLADALGCDVDAMMSLSRPEQDTAEKAEKKEKSLTKAEAETAAPEKKTRGGRKAAAKKPAAGSRTAARKPAAKNKAPEGEPATLGAYIRQVRTEKGLSMREMRYKCNMPVDTLIKIEDDQKKLILEKELKAIAKGLDADLGTMFRLAGFPEEKIREVTETEQEQSDTRVLRNIKEKDPEMLELMHRVTMELGKREREALKTIIRGMLK